MAFLLDGKPLNELDASQIARLRDPILLGIIKRNVTRSENAFNVTANQPFLQMVIAEARKRKLKSNYLTILDPPPCSLCGTGKGLLLVRGKTYCRKPLCQAMARREMKKQRVVIERRQNEVEKLVRPLIVAADQRALTRNQGRGRISRNKR